MEDSGLNTHDSLYPSTALPYGIDALDITPLVNRFAIDLRPGVGPNGRHLSAHYHLCWNATVPEQTRGDRRALQAPHSFWVPDGRVVDCSADALDDIRTCGSLGYRSIPHKSVQRWKVTMEASQIENQKSEESPQKQTLHDNHPSPA